MGMATIKRCNVVYTKDGNSIGISKAKTPAAALKQATAAARNAADAEGMAWIKAEVANAKCPAACPGKSQYLVVRRGKPRTLAVFPCAFRFVTPVAFEAVVLQGWRAEYWCGHPPGRD